MNDTTLIRLDLLGITTIEAIHNYLCERFLLPKETGKNWDAFWDFMRFYFVGDGEVVVEVENYDKMDLEMQEYCTPLIEIFERIQRETPNVRFYVK